MTAPSLGWQRTVVLLAIFVLSGASSLVYQILWVRVLSLTVGSTVYAISLVISAFMGGLALGSAYFGRKADRFGHPLKLYAFLELGIGAAAALLPFAFMAIARSVAVRSGPFADLFASSVFPFVACFLLLLIPTTLMGGTLPVLSRYVSGFGTSRGGSIGILYALNTAGAIVGTAITGFILIRTLGITQTTLLAAGVNGLIFAVSFHLSRRWPAPDPVAIEPPTGARAAEADSRRLLGAVTVVYAVNGMAGLALEVLWTRAILLFSVNTIYAFTVILTTFLVGLTVGSSVMSAWVDRIRRPGVVLGVLQCALAFIAALTPLALNAMGLSLFKWGSGLFDPMGLWGRVLSAYVVAAAFMLPATLVMGASFPLVARLVAGATDRVGAAVGRVYALNTLGAVAGSLLAGFVTLPLVGIQGSILVFAAVASVSGLYLLVRTGARPLAGGAVAVTAGIVVLFVASPNHFQDMLGRHLDEELTYYEEGVETTVGVYDSQKARRPVLVINNTALDDRGVVHKLLVHLPMLFHPDPTRALVLGFGVGISNESLSAYDVPVNDCVEISPGVMNAAPYFASINGNVADRDDANFRVFVEDGRRLLLRETAPYDLIVLDANSGNLRNAGVGKLYTRDFFEICHERLADDGMATLYASPNGSLREFKMVARTFQEVFPHTTLWVDRVFGQTCVLLGSKTPVRMDLARMYERMQSPRVTKDLEVFDLDSAGALLGCFLMGPEMLRQFSHDGELNTDDRPLMEFYPLKMTIFDADDRPTSDAGFLVYQESILPYLDIPPGEPWVREVLDFVAGEEQTFRSLSEAWIYRWNSNTQLYQSTMGIVNGLHPETEHVRTLLGFGRRAVQGAMEEARSTGTAEAYGRVGAMLLRRQGWPDAATALGEAIARWKGPTTGPEASALAGFHIGRAQALRESGRPQDARPHLDAAEALGVDVALDRSRNDLAATTDPAARVPILNAVAQGSLQRLDLLTVVETILELREMGQASQQYILLAARAMEALGDLAGSWILCRELLDSAPDLADAQAGLRRAGIELAMRHNASRLAHGAEAGRYKTLWSPFLEESAPANEVGVLDHTTPGPWLELVELYLASRRSFLAYRKARAARTVAPNEPRPYEAIHRAALALGNDEIADAAMERARALGATVSLAGAGALGR